MKKLNLPGTNNLISAIITTYKRPKLLYRAINSVIEQAKSLTTDLEMIISDDDPFGSGLYSLNQIDPELIENIRFKYIKRGAEQSGVAASRNRSIAIADGEWIAFLDDDDALIADAFQALYSATKNESVDFCFGSYERITENLDHTPSTKTAVPIQWSSYDQLLLSNFIPVGSFLIKKSVIQSKFNLNLKTHEDWLFLLDNLKNAKVKSIPQSVVQIYQADDNSREHRNSSGGFKQIATDFATIYSLHPKEELVAYRKLILEKLGHPHPGIIFD